MNYTESQLRAIEAGGDDILVSAAAGSGKTEVLTERIVRQCLDKNVDVNQLVVVTFTEAAAGQIKKKLEDKLRAALVGASHALRERIGRQLTLLGKANISTIDAFCAKIVRRFFYNAGVDPLFKIVDDTENNLIKNNVLSELFEDLYRREENKKFLDLVEAFGDKVRDDSLRELILTIYEFTLSQPFPEEWLNTLIDKKYSSFEDIVEEPWYLEIVGFACDKLRAAADFSEKLIEKYYSCPFLPAPILWVLEEDKRQVLQILYILENGRNGYAEMRNAFKQLNFGKLSSEKSKKCTDGRFTDDEIRALRDEIRLGREEWVKKPINALVDGVFGKAEDEALDISVGAAGLVSELCRIVKEFRMLFAEEKRARNLVDFADLEHLCLQILVEKRDGKVVRTKEAEELSAEFVEIMIDEYQDSNLVQEILLTAISRRQDRNMFMVGDAKQSIYRFRSAEPSIFTEKYDDYKLEGKGILIPLSSNFRSRSEVIDSVNVVFERLMSKKYGEIEYDDISRLYAAKEYPPTGQDNRTEIIVTGKEEDVAEEEMEDISFLEAEARVVAARIKELIDSKFLVTGKNGELQSANFGDVVILLRSLKNAASVFADALANVGVPCFSEKGGSWFDAPESLVAMSFLQIIDNPLQDIPLLAVLHSPIYEFTADEMAAVRLLSTGGYYFDALKHYAANGDNLNLIGKINAFLRQLDEFRLKNMFLPMSSLVWEVLYGTELMNRVGARRGGALRQANLNMLFRRAAQFEKSGSRGLFQFIRYMEKARDAETFQEAKEVAGNVDAVRVMSIHKSKGMEFPVVFVCGLGRLFNLKDTQKPVILHRKLGAACDFADADKRVKYDSLAKFAFSSVVTRETKSEELRVLYVAMTRAREKLFLVGGADKMDELIKKTDDRELPSYVLMKERQFLPLIVRAVAKGGEISPLFKYSAATPPVETAEKKAVFKEIRVISTENVTEKLRRDVTDRLYYNYVSDNVNFPLKMSVSEIKRRYDEIERADSIEMVLERIADEGEESALAVPKFLDRSILSPAERGTLLHLVLQKLPFNIQTLEEIKQFLHTLEKKGTIAEEELKYINKDKIMSFLKSEICEKIRKAALTKKEWRFIIGVPPKKLGIEDAKIEILVHGIIDLWFEDEDGVTILDYKTGRTKDPRKTAEKYAKQMEFYKLAVEKSTKKRVVRQAFYFFDEEILFEI